MAVETVTLQIPEILYQRLVNTARATQQPLENVILHEVGGAGNPLHLYHSDAVGAIFVFLRYRLTL